MKPNRGFLVYNAVIIGFCISEEAMTTPGLEQITLSRANEIAPVDSLSNGTTRSICCALPKCSNPIDRQFHETKFL